MEFSEEINGIRKWLCDMYCSVIECTVLYRWSFVVIVSGLAVVSVGDWGLGRRVVFVIRVQSCGESKILFFLVLKLMIKNGSMEKGVNSVVLCISFPSNS